jgi:hypothetical protein
MAQVWEYQVEQFGSALKPVKPEELEIFLNESSLEGWELGHTVSSGNKLLVVMRRKVESREKRRQSSWP